MLNHFQRQSTAVKFYGVDLFSFVHIRAFIVPFYIKCVSHLTAVRRLLVCLASKNRQNIKCGCQSYRIYSNKRRGAYLLFRVTSAALIRGRRLFKHCTRQIYFFYIFIQRYTFHPLIFLWTDTKPIVNLEIRQKLRR